MKYRFKISKPPVVSSKFKVYFNNETGKILSITNKQLNEHTDYFDIPVQDVEDFLTGEKDMTKHRVVFNVREQRYNIVNNKESIVVYVDDHIFKIGCVNNPEIIVRQDLTKNVWSISANDHVKESMKQVGARLEEVMLYSITQKNNPNILYNHFYVSIRDVLEKNSVEFKFICQDERDTNGVSVYTNRKFSKYCHEVVDV